MKELLSCPFCGGAAAYGTVGYSVRHVREQGWDQDTFYFINCINCGANNKGIVGYKSRERAKECWNGRINP